MQTAAAAVVTTLDNFPCFMILLQRHLLGTRGGKTNAPGLLGKEQQQPYHIFLLFVAELMGRRDSHTMYTNEEPFLSSRKPL